MLGSQDLTGSVSSVYVAQGADTLRSVAQQVYGDGNLWYLIAEANGSAGANPSAALPGGQALVVPWVQSGQTGLMLSGTGGVVGAGHDQVRGVNDAYRDYSQSESLGNTSPYLPPPTAGADKCVMLLLIVITVVVTVMTSGAAAIGSGAVPGLALADASLAQVFSAGLGALGGGVTVGGVAVESGFGTAMSAALGGMVGSVASQGAAVMMGLQDDIDFGRAAVAGVGAGVGSAVNGWALDGGAGSFLASTKDVTGWVAGAARATITSVATQAVGVLAGYQNSVNWRSAAASGVASLASWDVDPNSSPVAQLAGRFASGVVSGAVRQLVMQDRVDFGAIAVDSFGQALGNSIVRRGTGGISQQEALAGMDHEYEIYKQPATWQSPLGRQSWDSATREHVISDDTPSNSGEEFAVMLDAFQRAADGGVPGDPEDFVRVARAKSGEGVLSLSGGSSVEDDIADLERAIKGQKTVLENSRRQEAERQRAAREEFRKQEKMDRSMAEARQDFRRLEIQAMNAEAVPVPSGVGAGGGVPSVAAIEEARSDAQASYREKQDEAVTQGNAFKYVGATFGGLAAEVGYDFAAAARGVYGLFTESEARSRAVQTASYLATHPGVVVEAAVTGVRNFAAMPFEQQAQAVFKGGLGTLASAPMALLRTPGVAGELNALNKVAGNAARAERLAAEVGGGSRLGLDNVANSPGANFERIASQVPGRTIGRADAMNPGALGDNIAGTFSGGRYATIDLSEDLVLHRAWAPGSAREFGGFWSLEKPVGSLQTRIDSALLPEWGTVRGTSFRSQATDYTSIRVPAGTRVHAGEVGGQGGPWVGSGSQLLIDGGPQEAWKIGGGKLW